MRSVSYPAPRHARRAIESRFARLYRASFGASPPASNPRVVDLLWSISKGSLETVLRRTERALRDAATRGYRIDLGVVWTRWDELGRRAA